MTYNLCSLIHLLFYFMANGFLDKFSHFKYENYLRIIEKIDLNSRDSLQEATNRILESVNILHNIYENIDLIEIHKLSDEYDLIIQTFNDPNYIIST